MSTIIPSLLAILGVAIGATLQFVLTRRASHERHRTEQIATGYADFLEALASVGAALSYDDQEMNKNAQRDLLSARSRIAIYGNVAVIGALAEFSRLGDTIGTMEQKWALIRVVQEMRKHTAAMPVSDDDASRLILYEDLTNAAK